MSVFSLSISSITLFLHAGFVSQVIPVVLRGVTGFVSGYTQCVLQRQTITSATSSDVNMNNDGTTTTTTALWYAPSWVQKQVDGTYDVSCHFPASAFSCQIAPSQVLLSDTDIGGDIDKSSSTSIGYISYNLSLGLHFSDHSSSQ